MGICKWSRGRLWFAGFSFQGFADPVAPYLWQRIDGIVVQCFCVGGRTTRGALCIVFHACSGGTPQCSPCAFSQYLPWQGVWAARGGGQALSLYATPPSPPPPPPPEF